MSHLEMQSTVDFTQDATIIHGGRAVRGGVRAHMDRLAAGGNLMWDVLKYDAADVDHLRAQADAILHAFLSPGVASFTWPKSGLGVDPESRAFVWPQVPADEVRDALDYDLPYERCCIELTVTRNGVSNTIFWNLLREDNGFRGFFTHFQNGVALLTGIGVEFDRTKLNDLGLPVYTYLVPPSFEKHYNVLEIRQQMYMILRFLRILYHPEVRIEESRPSRLRRSMYKRKGGVPLDVHRTVFIDMDKVVFEERAHLGGTHASPIEHVRRGHYRELRSGRSVWVRESIVNRRRGHPLPSMPTYTIRDRRHDRGLTSHFFGNSTSILAPLCLQGASKPPCEELHDPVKQ